jgi:hypothetical protein
VVRSSEELTIIVTGAYIHIYIFRNSALETFFNDVSKYIRNISIRLNVVLPKLSDKHDRAHRLYEYRCDERLKDKAEGSTLLTYTGLHGGLEHLQIETRLIDERFPSVTQTNENFECQLFIVKIAKIKTFFSSYFFLRFFCHECRGERAVVEEGRGVKSVTQNEL